MKVRHADKDLERLEWDSTFTGGFAKEIVRAFRKVMNFIRNAKDERDLRSMRSLNFEKLKGDRSHQYSLRLNKQWRLIVEIEEGEGGNTIVVVAIEDYH
jgi:proteic killer suppression protein